jgi:hypothetical protein
MDGTNRPGTGSESTRRLTGCNETRCVDVRVPQGQAPAERTRATRRANIRQSVDQGRVPRQLLLHRPRASQRLACDAVLLDQPAEGAAVLAGFTCGVRDVTVVLAQKVFDLAALERFHGGGAGCTEMGRWRFGGRLSLRQPYMAREDLRTIARHFG